MRFDARDWKRVTIFCATGGGAAYAVNCGVRKDGYHEEKTTIEMIGRSIRVARPAGGLR